MVWFQGSVRYQGTLLGYTADDQPCVHAPRRGEWVLDNLDAARLQDPYTAVGPCWERLQPSATLVRPAEQEAVALRAFLDRMVPPGVPHRALVEEIANRGYEVFLTGSSVRQLIASTDTSDPEFVTTMPLGRLHNVVTSMYGPDHVTFGERHRRLGRLRVGGGENPSDRFAVVRLFRLNDTSVTPAIFGGDFNRDVQYRDFSCNALYFEPTNEVVVDPTGYGLTDATGCCVRLIQQEDRPPDESARIGLRVIGFLLQGYSVAEEHGDQVERLLRQLPALSQQVMVAAIKAEIFQAMGDGDAQEVWDQVRLTFEVRGLQQVWIEHVEPHREELLA